MSFRRRVAASRLLAPLLFSLAAGSLATSALAQPRPAFTKVDPAVYRIIRSGLTGPLQKFRKAPGLPTGVLIELDQDVDAVSVRKLHDLGVEVSQVDGKVLSYGRFVNADVDEAGADALGKASWVRSVQATEVSRGPMPLDHSAELLRLADARGARPALDLITGQGMVIGDVDSDVDIFHPTFFKGDAGYYDWIDVDGDGVFTPGVDRIDFAKDGTSDPANVGKLVIADTLDFFGNETGARTSEAFDPGTDWIYIDTDGNNQRDYGPPNFDDTVPGFGEPLFVPDDVNRNGKIDVGERFVRLGTSKFRDIYIRVKYGANVDKTFHRGTNMTAIPINITNSALYGFPDALHATGVDSILAGDVPLVGRRWVGMAPDADMVVAFDVESTGDGLPSKGTTWALGQKPDVMLYELATWTGSALDGSDPLSTLIDASEEKDQVTHTCPTGDQASARKHAHAPLAALASNSFTLNVPDSDKAGQGPLGYVEVTLDSVGGLPAAMTITEPGGATYVVTTDSQGTLSSGAIYQSTSKTTKRGTGLIDVILYNNQKPTTPVPVGDWKVAVTAGATPITADVYVQDDVSSWALGAGWDKAIATDTSTVGVPSVADHCIAVGAHPNHVADDAAPWYDMYYGDYDVPDGYAETQGQVRAYSPRGPRIDLVQKPDILAPDNPWSAAVHDSETPAPYGGFEVFGGTSGASPHVTGVAALLAQAGIKGDAARDAMRAGAIHDKTTGDVPNQDYGYGRLDAAGAFGVKGTSKPPTVTLTASTKTPKPGESVVLTPKALAADGTDSGLEAKWDDGYDGTWDTGYAAVAPRMVTVAEGKNPYKVRVRDAGGHIAEALVLLDTNGTPGTGGAGGTGSTSSAGGDGGSGSGKPSGGCGCELSPIASGGTPWVILAGAGLVLGRRRRRG